MLLRENNKRKSKSPSGCLGNGGHFLISTHQPGKITQLETRLMQLRYIQERQIYEEILPKAFGEFLKKLSGQFHFIWTEIAFEILEVGFLLHGPASTKDVKIWSDLTFCALFTFQSVP